MGGLDPHTLGERAGFGVGEVVHDEAQPVGEGLEFLQQGLGLTAVQAGLVGAVGEEQEFDGAREAKEPFLDDPLFFRSKQRHVNPRINIPCKGI